MNVPAEPSDGRPHDTPVPIPITDELDLHTFRPAEVAELLESYFEECRKLGLRTVRLVHGKGTGALRERVHTLLRQSAAVESFARCDESGGGWGATRVRLRLPETKTPRAGREASNADDESSG